MGRSRFKILVEDKFGTFTDEYQLDAGEFLVGRSRQCHINLPADNVSRRHARLFIKDSALFIEDLGSANGTYVNGKRIKKATLLLDGTVVKIGDFHLHVYGGPKDMDQNKVYLRLIGLNRSVKDEVFEVKDKTAVIGRGGECQIIVVDPSVSRVHARFVVTDEGTILVKDLGSANGTFVNGKRVGTWELTSGDTFKIGDLEFKIEIPYAQTTKTRGDWLIPTPERPWWVKWAVGLGVLVLLIVVVMFFLGRKGPRKETPRKAIPVRKPQTSPSQKKQVKVVTDVSPLVKEAQTLYLKGRLKAARKLVLEGLTLHPGHKELEKLKKEIEKELDNYNRLQKAGELIKGEEWDKAVEILLEIPKDSRYDSSSKAMLRILEPELEKLIKKACRSRKKRKECSRLKELRSKLQASIQQAEGKRGR